MLVFRNLPVAQFELCHISLHLWPQIQVYLYRNIVYYMPIAMALHILDNSTLVYQDLANLVPQKKLVWVRYSMYFLSCNLVASLLLFQDPILFYTFSFVGLIKSLISTSSTLAIRAK